MKRFWIFGLVILLCCNEKEADMKPAWPLGVKYEIFVLAFADSNGDGKGDLKGLTQKLDYVSDLGVNGIWMMPIMPSPSYHKYDVTDYKNIHADYGSLEDFKLLVEEAHKRGIHIVIDLVLNHTSKEHPWFKNACEGKQAQYRNYFVWADKDSIQDQISKKATTLDSDNITQWHAVNGDEKAEHYYGFFSGHMPDLNFDNPKVREEVVDIARFWLTDMKVDGFRFDAARHIYPDDRAKDNHDFWIWYRDELRKIKPDVYLIGEVYSTDRDEVVPYTKGLPSLFNFEMGRAIINSVNLGEDTLGLAKTYNEQNQFFKSTAADFLDSPILTNHDQNRIMSELNDDVNKAKVAASIFFSLPGAPYIYYGEEIGMSGKKPDEFIREPFLWGEQSITTTWVAPRYNTDSTLVSLAGQQKDPQSLYNHYKKWIAYRNNNAALTSGGMQSVDQLPKGVVGMVRVTDSDEKLVLHNISNAEISFENPKPGFSEIDFATNDLVKLQNNTITLPPYGSAAFTKP